MVILASGSPRRRELLKLIIDDYEIMKAEKDEVVTKTEPSEIVEELSKAKADEVWEKAIGSGKVSEGNNLLIAADTLVFCQKERMGKPADEEDAYKMLKKLSGNTHDVFTGVTIYYGNEKLFKKVFFYEDTKVTFYDIDDKEIRDYIASGEPMDKAGAYAIQTGFCRNIKSIEGEYSNVVGLPVARLYQELKKIGYFEFT